jgi:hypothetical protein
MRAVMLICIISMTAFAQEHAPTVEQCKADQALWGADHTQTAYNEAETRHVESGAVNRTEIAMLSITQLKQRMRGMYECEDVVAMDPYHSTGNFYYSVIADRYLGFLIRHGLMPQLVKEDAAGER